MRFFAAHQELFSALLIWEQAMPRLFPIIRDARLAEAGLRSPHPKEIPFATELVPPPLSRGGGAGACATAGSRSRRST